MERNFLILVFFLLTILNAQEIIWLRRFDLGMNEYVGGITFDQEGNVIIGGAVCDHNTGYDILLVKYDPNGETIWARHYIENEDEWLTSIMIDSRENIIGVGAYSNDTIESQCMIVKFSPNGDVLWKRYYRLRDIDGFTDLKVDDSNHIIVTGFSYSYAGGGNSFGFLRKYDEYGNEIWTKFYTWAGFVNGITKIPHSSDFFITGTYGREQMMIARVDPCGDTIWIKKLPGTCGIGYGITYDFLGNIIAVGYERDSLYDWRIIKCNFEGNIIWTRREDFMPYEYATSVVCDSYGNIYVGGSIGWLRSPFEDTCDYLLVKYSSEGERIYTCRYNGGYDDKLSKVIIDSYKNLIVTGISWNGTNYDILTIKYSGTGIEEDNFIRKLDFKISPSYLKNQFMINFNLPKESFLKIEIFDISGKLHKMINLGRLKKGNHQIKLNLSKFPKGIYFLRLKYGKEEIIEKLTILK